tara:strand:+ start:465 stop:845 length:381 start_codon:yes stop_codon:yes gene_type:complete
VQGIKTPFITAVSGIDVLGEECVTGVSYTVVGKVYYIHCNLMMLHLGPIPETQQCSQARVAVAGQTSVPNLQIAGAYVAQFEGRLVGISRADLGARQGRQCGLNLAYLVAHAQQRQVVEPFVVCPR